MLTAPFNPKAEKEALAAALGRFHEQWEQRTSIQVFLDFCDATQRALDVVAALTIDAEPHDTETHLQLVQMKILLNSAMQVVAHVQDEPVAAPITFYPTSEEQPRDTPTSTFPPGTIVSCPKCGEGLYKMTTEASTVGLVLDEGTTLAPLNRSIPPRHAWSTLVCPLCGGRLLRDGKIHTFQHGWI